MMIDIEKLKTDRAYWDKVAPKGARYAWRGLNVVFSEHKDKEDSMWWPSNEPDQARDDFHPPAWKNDFICERPE